MNVAMMVPMIGSRSGSIEFDDEGEFRFGKSASSTQVWYYSQSRSMVSWGMGSNSMNRSTSTTEPVSRYYASGHRRVSHCKASSGRPYGTSQTARLKMEDRR